MTEEVLGDTVGLQYFVERAFLLSAGYQEVVLSIDGSLVFNDRILFGGSLANRLLGNELKQVLIELIAIGQAAVDSECLNLVQRDGRTVDGGDDRPAAGTGCCRECK